MEKNRNGWVFKDNILIKEGQFESDEFINNDEEEDNQ